MRNPIDPPLPPLLQPPPLRFTPTAWAKLLFLRDAGPTEVGGFGISATDDLLLVEDVRLVTQSCSWGHVAFDDEAVADFFDEKIDAGFKPAQFGRIWIHTHPGDCPEPSAIDEETFSRVFGTVDWAVMFILAKGGASYGRLAFNVGPGAAVETDAVVDFTVPFAGSDHATWQAEYDEHVRPVAVEPSPETYIDLDLAALSGDECEPWALGHDDFDPTRITDFEEILAHDRR